MTIVSSIHSLISPPTCVNVNCCSMRSLKTALSTRMTTKTSIITTVSSMPLRVRIIVKVMPVVPVAPRDVWVTVVGNGNGNENYHFSGNS